MKALKVIAAVIISIILLISGILLAGLFSADKALSADSVKESVTQSELISELLDEALRESTVNMGGEYGDMVGAVLRTDAMENFFTNYIIAAINTGIYGEDYEEIANDELMNAFSQGIDEVNSAGQISISATEEEQLKQAMMQEAPDLTDTMNNNISQYQAAEGELTQEMISPSEGLQFIMGTGIRIVLLIVCLGLLAALAALFWRSKLGFIWGAAVTALVTFIYGGLALSGAEVITDSAESSADQFILTMVTNGVGVVAIVGGAVTVILVALCFILRYFDRKNGRGMNNSIQMSEWKRAD